MTPHRNFVLGVCVRGWEVDANILFRGNTLATKSIDHYMKFVGAEYLRRVLAAPVMGVLRARDCCEVREGFWGWVNCEPQLVGFCVLLQNRSRLRRSLSLCTFKFICVCVCVPGCVCR